MRKILLSVVLATTLALTSCQFDDSDIWGKLDEYGESIRDHEQRISALEELCKQMNTNIEALQTLVDALEKRDYVTNVSEVRSNGEVIGYTISFAHSDTITIYHGKDGKDGANGADGKDGYTPQIGVMKDTDNIYYWTLDGEWLLDGKGNKIQANGVNGTNGTNGTNGVTPQLKIENDYWYVSYDNGATWEKLGNASSGSSSSNCVITNVEESETEVVFTLNDGSTITLPKGEKAEVVAENHKIYYTTTDGKRMFPYYTEPNYFGAMLVSNTYKNGQGVLMFDGPVTKFTGWAFYECPTLKTITIPDSVTEVDGGVRYCVSLEAFYGKYASADNRCLIVDGVLVSFAPSGLTEYTIPEGVTSIGDDAFRGCASLTSVTIPNSVTSIGNYAFAYCSSLKTITLSDNTVLIKEDDYSSAHFYGCDSLTDVYVNINDLAKYCVGNPISEIPSNKHLLIDGVEITELVIPDSVTSIGSSAFENCNSLTSVTIPDSVTSIGGYAFCECTSLTSVTIGNRVTSIENCAFYGIFVARNNFTNNSSLDAESANYWGAIVCDIIQEDGLCIDGTTVVGCKESSVHVTIPDGVTSIGSSAFGNCNSLTSVTIPDSVTSIGEHAFSSSTSLTSVTIGSGVKSIGNNVFYNCRSLKEIYCKPTTPPSIYYSSFPYYSEMKIYVPRNSYDSYMSYAVPNYNNISQNNWNLYESCIKPYDFE